MGSGRTPIGPQCQQQPLQRTTSRQSRQRQQDASPSLRDSSGEQNLLMSHRRSDRGVEHMAEDPQHVPPSHQPPHHLHRSINFCGNQTMITRRSRPTSAMGELIGCRTSRMSLANEPIYPAMSHASDEVCSILHHRMSNGRQPVNYIEYETASVMRPQSVSR